MTPIRLLHFTHVDNLPSILRGGSLLSDARARSFGVRWVDVARRDIKSRRRRTMVEVAAGGVLTDYVPFYFAPRSPMLEALSRRTTPATARAEAGGRDPQTPLVYPVADLAAVTARRIPFAFTDGHTTDPFSGIYGDLADLDQVDWPLMAAESFDNTREDPDRKRRRSAEFLAHESVPWSAFRRLVARSPMSPPQPSRPWPRLDDAFPSGSSPAGTSPTAAHPCDQPPQLRR